MRRSRSSMDNRGVNAMGTGGADLNKLRCRSERKGPMPTASPPWHLRTLPSLARAPSYECPTYFSRAPKPDRLVAARQAYAPVSGRRMSCRRRTIEGAPMSFGNVCGHRYRCSRVNLPLGVTAPCVLPIAASGASRPKTLTPSGRSVLRCGSALLQVAYGKVPAVTARSAHRRAAFHISRAARSKALGRAIPARRQCSPHHRQHVCTAIESAATCFTLSVSRLRVGHQCTDLGGSGPTGPSTLSAVPAPSFSSNAARRSGFPSGMPTRPALDPPPVRRQLRWFRFPLKLVLDQLGGRPLERRHEVAIRFWSASCARPSPLAIPPCQYFKNAGVKPILNASSPPGRGPLVIGLKSG